MWWFYAWKIILLSICSLLMENEQWKMLIFMENGHLLMEKVFYLNILFTFYEHSLFRRKTNSLFFEIVTICFYKNP